MGQIEILGGIGLTLFGVRFLRKGLDRLFGGKIVGMLGRMTVNRFRAFVAGIGMGTIAPSSAALTISAVQMLERTRMDSGRILAVLLGANIGLTVTVQLLAFRIQDYAGLFIFLGIIGFMFLSRELFRGIGQCVLSLGFIFLAMKLIGDGAQALTSGGEMKVFFGLLEGHPWIVAIAVAALAVILQSSTATIGLGLALSTAGLLTPPVLAPWVIGTNLGLGVTSLIVGWREVESRRMGLANLLLKLALAVPLIVFPAAGATCFGFLGHSLMRQTAMFHTGFNLVVGLVALPLLTPLGRAMRFMIPAAPVNDMNPRVSYLDPAMLDTPSLALTRATRETLHMSDKVRAMLETYWRAFREGNVELSRRVQREDDEIDRINLELTHYLSRIADVTSPDDTHWQFSLLGYSKELESVADIVEKQLCDLLVKQHTEGIILSPENIRLLTEGYSRALARFELADSLLVTRSVEDAKTFLEGKEAFNTWCRNARRSHLQSLHNYTKDALAGSAFFQDMLNAFQKINSHMSTIGYSIAVIPER